MNNMIKLLGVLALLPCVAQAADNWYSKDHWEVKVGLNRISPRVNSGDLTAPSLPGTKINVGPASAPIATVRYSITDNIGVEFFGGLPYTHKIEGAGAVAGVGKIGESKQISPTLILQYRFNIPSLQIRPYLGAGLTYAYFYDERGSNILTAMTNPGGSATTMKIDGALGSAVEGGIQFNLNKAWFVDASIIKAFLSTTSTLSTGQSIKTDVDPVATNLSVGYRF